MANKLRFGIGGLPHTNTGNTNDGIRRLRELGLDHLELEFVHSVFLDAQQAAAAKEVAEEQDISLSVHGSYYINLASDDSKKWHAGITRIAKAAEIGALAGARSVTYHSGFFQKKSFAEVKDRVLDGMRKVLKELDQKEIGISIAPELTGKESQVGDLGELIEMIKILEDEGESQVSLCIDFAHKYARSIGEFNSYDHFMSMLDDVRAGLGDQHLDNLHIHISGIEYGDKGEKNHLTFLDSLEEYKAEGIEVEGIEASWKKVSDKKKQPNKFKWQELLKALHAQQVGGMVVCESPILELDALLMQKYYNSL